MLQKHSLSEADIIAQKERARSLEAQVQKFVDEKHPDSAKIVQKSGELDAACQRLQSLLAMRLARLKVKRENRGEAEADIIVLWYSGGVEERRYSSLVPDFIKVLVVMVTVPWPHTVGRYGQRIKLVKVT